MTHIFEKFLVRARRSGLSLPVLILGAATILGLSLGISGLEGLLFTLAIGLAYLLGTASRDGPFHLRSLVETPLGHPVDRHHFEARLAADSDVPNSAGQALCIRLALDGFDDLIAQHGHRAATNIIRQIGQRLYGEIRLNDCLADFGNGQFAIYLPANLRLDPETAVQTALRLNTAVARPLALDGLRLHLTACAGFCISGRLVGATGGLNILEAAEIALDTAQREGPRVLRAFDHTMAIRKVTQPPTQIDLDLQVAFEEDQIGPFFQPQLCADTGRLTGLEALARWHHPSKGILGPAHFLKSLLAQGLSQRLTDTMIRRSLEQLCQWDSVGIHIPRISVNLGVEDLVDPALCDRITWFLDQHDLPPARLGIEVLESVVAKADPDDVTAANLLALGRMGCHIDLDDFGTGNASLNAIRRFKVDRIKIDRTLVTAVDQEKSQHQMIAAILIMAQQLNVDVLAEGVETPGEHSALAQLGCHHVQGYVIARPMPAADLLAWVLRRSETTPSPACNEFYVKSAESLRRDAPQKGFRGKTA